MSDLCFVSTHEIFALLLRLSVQYELKQGQNRHGFFHALTFFEQINSSTPWTKSHFTKTLTSSNIAHSLSIFVNRCNIKRKWKRSRSLALLFRNVRLLCWRKNIKWKTKRSNKTAYLRQFFPNGQLNKMWILEERKREGEERKKRSMQFYKLKGKKRFRFGLILTAKFGTMMNKLTIKEMKQNLDFISQLKT